MNDKKRKPGRPWVNPVGSRPRTYRVTDAEHLRILLLLAEWRGKKKPARPRAG